MPEGITSGGSKATGYTEIRNGICEKCNIPFEATGDEKVPWRCPKCGDCQDTLLVAFNSEDAQGYWENEYQKERIDYCMRHRRDKIPMYLRTGKKPLFLRIGGEKGLEQEAKRLKELNLKEGGQSSG